VDDINRHIKIDNYLNGNLPAEEVIAFELKMKTDLSLKEEVDAFKLANDAIKLGAQADIKLKLQAIHQDHLKAKKRKLWGYSGLTLLLSLITLTVIFNPFSTDKKLAKNSLTEDKAIVESANNYPNENSSEISTNEQKIITQKTTINSENSSEKLVKNIDTIIETKIEKSDLNVESIVQDENIENYSNELGNEISTTTKTVEEATKDPCELINKTTPKYDIKWPCLGHEQGSFELLNSSNEIIDFTEYSLDGGESYHSIFETTVVNRGSYNLIVKDDKGCLTKNKKMIVKYRNCNFIVQPSYGKFLELNLSEYIDYPILIEIRNARSAQVVYKKNITPGENFIWEGKDQSNSTLPLGNYVYFFISNTEGLVAQGQITVVN
jgi:hypothetical protein